MKSGTVRTRNTVGPPDWLLWQSKSAWHTAPMTRFTLQPIEPIESRPSQQKVEACSAPLQCSSRASKKATRSYEAKQSSSSSLRLQLWQLRDIQFLDLLAGTYKNPSHVADIYEKEWNMHAAELPRDLLQSLRPHPWLPWPPWPPPLWPVERNDGKTRRQSHQPFSVMTLPLQSKISQVTAGSVLELSPSWQVLTSESYE